MTRIVIALEPDIKRWLDHKALQEGVPMTGPVRLLQHTERDTVTQILERSGGICGIWTRGDGLE